MVRFLALGGELFISVYEIFGHLKLCKSHQTSFSDKFFNVLGFTVLLTSTILLQIL